MLVYGALVVRLTRRYASGHRLILVKIYCLGRVVGLYITGMPRQGLPLGGYYSRPYHLLQLTYRPYKTLFWYQISAGLCFVLVVTRWLVALKTPC